MAMNADGAANTTGAARAADDLIASPAFTEDAVGNSQVRGANEKAAAKCRCTGPALAAIPAGTAVAVQADSGAVAAVASPAAVASRSARRGVDQVRQEICARNGHIAALVAGGTALGESGVAAEAARAAFAAGTGLLSR